MTNRCSPSLRNIHLGVCIMIGLILTIATAHSVNKTLKHSHIMFCISHRIETFVHIDSLYV